MWGTTLPIIGRLDPILFHIVSLGHYNRDSIELCAPPQMVGKYQGGKLEGIYFFIENFLGGGAFLYPLQFPTSVGEHFSCVSVSLTVSHECVGAHFWFISVSLKVSHNMC